MSLFTVQPLILPVRASPTLLEPFFRWLYFFATPDGSFVLNPRLDVSIAQNADLVIFGGYTMGKDEGAFPPGYLSLVARATVWF